MVFDPQIHHRRSIRLKEYDYSQSGAYFVTICTNQRIPIFGKVVGAGSKPAPVAMRLNNYGKIVEDTWHDLVNHITGIELGEFVIMPNHVHCIIWIKEHLSGTDFENLPGAGLEYHPGAGLEPAPTEKRTPLFEIVRQFKTFSAQRINKIRGMPGQSVWQRNYYEHVIRGEDDYLRIAEYILPNPIKWENDDLFLK